jgi:uncharacterized Zn-binding protein involved in type VI secretion
MRTKQWHVELHIGENGDDTHVRAILTAAGRTSVEGHGHARRNPVDRAVPEIGDELAAGRALIELGNRLVQIAGADIEESVSLG